MPSKYKCPKCGRRFTAWGAEKVGFKCPNDEWTSGDHGDHVELVPVGAGDDKAAKKASLKRTPRRLAPVSPPTFVEDEVAETTIDEADSIDKSSDDFDEEEDDTEEGDTESGVRKTSNESDDDSTGSESDSDDSPNDDDALDEDVAVDEDSVSGEGDSEEWSE